MKYPTYHKPDLFRLAEIGYHYLLNGGYETARVIFEGLAEIEPQNDDHLLALGLLYNYLGLRRSALEAYLHVTSRNPQDPVAEINIAELLIQANQLETARKHLQLALRKARELKSRRLEQKTTALLSLCHPHAKTNV